MPGSADAKQRMAATCPALLCRSGFLKFGAIKLFYIRIAVFFNIDKRDFGTSSHIGCGFKTGGVDIIGGTQLKFSKLQAYIGNDGITEPVPASEV